MAASDDFTLDDFRKQFEQLKKMGPRSELLCHMPGLSEIIPDSEEPEVAYKRIQNIIDAMTGEERRDPDLIDFCHRQRVAAESGTDPEEVERFLEQFKKVRKIMRKMREMSVGQRIKLALGFETWELWEKWSKLTRFQGVFRIAIFARFLH